VTAGRYQRRAILGRCLPKQAAVKDGPRLASRSIPSSRESVSRKIARPAKNRKPVGFGACIFPFPGGRGRSNLKEAKLMRLSKGRRSLGADFGFRGCDGGRRRFRKQEHGRCHARARLPDVRAALNFDGRARATHPRHRGRRLPLTRVRLLYPARCNPSSGPSHRGSKLHTGVCIRR
jgi:hypothetical protein